MNYNSLLLDIMKYTFYAIELNLYLDNFPNNTEATEDYKEISEKLDKLIYRYEQEFGPLTNFGSAAIENPRAWVNTPWPWENR